MIKRLLIWPIVFLLLLALLLISATVVLLSTDKGTQWLVETATPYVPGNLTIANFDGNIWRGIQVENLSYDNDAMMVHLQSADLRFDWKRLAAKRLQVTKLQLHELHVIQLVHEKEEEEDKEPFHPDNLDDIRLPIKASIPNAELHGFTLTNVEGEQFRVEHVQIAARTGYSYVQIQHVGVRLEEQEIKLNASMLLSKPFNINAEVSWHSELPEAAQKPLKTSDPAEGNLQVKGTLEELAFTHNLNAPMDMKTVGSARPFDTPLAFSVEHTWQPFNVFLEGEEEPDVPVDAGEIIVKGDLDKYTIDASTGTKLSINDNWQPTVDLLIKGEGSITDLVLEELYVKTPESSLTANGKVQWSPSITWDVNANANHFNPGVFLPDFEGDISGEVASTGKFENEDINAHVLLKSLHGEWLDQPLKGSGDFTIGPKNTMHGDVSLLIGDNSIKAKGNSSDKLNWHFNINAKRLDQLWPDLSGALTSKLDIAGTLERPLVNGHVNANNVGFAEQALDKLELAFDTKGKASDPDFNIKLKTGAVTSGENTLINSFALDAKGLLSRHQINWTLDLDEYEHTAQINAGLNDKNEWQGEIRTLNFDGPLTGNWCLAKKSPFLASAEKAFLEEMCLRQKEGFICAEGNWQNDGDITGKLDVKSMPLAFANAFIPDQAATLEGEINVHSLFEQNPGGKPKAEAEATLSEGHVLLDSGDADDPYKITWEGFKATAQLDDDNFASDFYFNIDNKTGMDGNLKGSLTDAIDGRFRMFMDDLAWVEILSPETRDVDGKVRGDIKIGGTLKEPTLDGDIGLQDLAVNIPAAGLELRKGNVTATAKQGEPIDINGSIASGGGELVITGTVPTEGEFPRPISINVKGSKFQAVQIPDAEAYIDPNISIQLIGSDLLVRGLVSVPTARITPKQLPVSATRVSPDEIIVDADVEDKGLLKTDVIVRVTLGDDVTMDGFGLKSHFTGDIVILDKTGHATRLIGSAGIKDGRFKAYGQDLRIDDGTVYFQGPPGNPGLDIDAYRLVPAYNVKAGLLLGGTLSNPRSKVYAEPDMEETEAMAFLLTGKPLDGGSDKDAAAIMQAIALYGIEKGDFITNKVADTLGIDVGVDTEGEFEDTSLVLGKQLSSRLYLQYSIGLFEALNTVMLRYTVSQYVNLETRSNAEEQSVDLIYRRER